MEKVIAKLRYLRVAPKKVRRLARLLKGMSFTEAEARLKLLPQKSAQPLYKLLLSAGANAENNYNLSKANLFIENILVDPGPVLERMRARARGMAAPIKKRTSHLTLFLSPFKGKEVSLKPTEKLQKAETKESRKLKSRSAKAGPLKKPEKKARLTKTAGVKQRLFRRKAI